MPETFVLITGAWHGGWAWRPVAEHLRASGHRALTPTLPGLADGDDPTRYRLSDVVDFVVDYVERDDLHDVTLVGHRWGGYPITGAAPRLAPRLRKLVYGSGFVPANGVPLLDEVPPHYVELFTHLAATSGDNTVALPLAVWRSRFMQDAGEDVQRMIHSLLVPQPMQYFAETVPALDLGALGVPVSYVITTDDIALPPGEWEWTPRFPMRLGVTPIEAPGSHEACFTRPAELASALLNA
ncbi:MAG: alpha/beta fold hydrolase [Pseudonocardiaceae bacterium]